MAGMAAARARRAQSTRTTAFMASSGGGWSETKESAGKASICLARAPDAALLHDLSSFLQNADEIEKTADASRK